MIRSLTNPREFFGNAGALILSRGSSVGEKDHVRSVPEASGNSSAASRGQDDVVVPGYRQLLDDRLLGFGFDQGEKGKELVDVGVAFVALGDKVDVRVL